MVCEIFDFKKCLSSDMNIKGYLDMANIVQINKLLCYFEEEFQNKYIHGKPIIKEEYTRRLIKK